MSISALHASVLQFLSNSPPEIFVRYEVPAMHENAVSNPNNLDELSNLCTESENEINYNERDG